MYQALNAAAQSRSATAAGLLRAGTPHAAIHRQATGAVAALGADQAAARLVVAGSRVAVATAEASQAVAAIGAKP